MQKVVLLSENTRNAATASLTGVQLDDICDSFAGQEYWCIKTHASLGQHEY